MIPSPQTLSSIWVIKLSLRASKELKSIPLGLEISGSWMIRVQLSAAAKAGHLSQQRDRNDVINVMKADALPLLNSGSSGQFRTLYMHCCFKTTRLGTVFIPIQCLILRKELVIFPVLPIPADTQYQQFGAVNSESSPSSQDVISVSFVVNNAFFIACDGCFQK